MISNPIRPSATLSESRQPRSQTLAIKTEKVLVHHEASEALMLSVAGVTTITLIANLILLILYWAPARSSKAIRGRQSTRADPSGTCQYAGKNWLRIAEWAADKFEHLSSRTLLFSYRVQLAGKGLNFSFTSEVARYALALGYWTVTTLLLGRSAKSCFSWSDCFSTSPHLVRCFGEGDLSGGWMTYYTEV
jgi:hypothetical protein